MKNAAARTAIPMWIFLFMFIPSFVIAVDNHRLIH
jgi:hypothetical protein